MLAEIDNITIFLGSVALALLSLYTIEKCRQDSTEHLLDYRLFLFQGKVRLYSLASNLGSVFSVTYFFGATFIYGHIFKAGLLIIATAIFGLLAIIVPRTLKLTRENLSPEELVDQRSSLLLELFKRKFQEKDFKILLRIYVFIYFGLLMEELAVSRLILTTLFPLHPIVPAMMLSTICFVIVAYIYFGGFRAVLISDYEQLKVVIPFVILLALLIIRDSPPRLARMSFTVPKEFSLWGGIPALIFGIAWFGAGLDFYGRFNFSLKPGEDPTNARIDLAYLSLATLFLLLIVGVIFGVHLTLVFPRIDSPTGYTQAVISYFLGQRSRTAIIIFFISLFSMIFTTLNVLLLTLLQLGAYLPQKYLKKERILQLLLLAVVASAALRFNAVSAIGVFIGSLLIIPLTALLFLLVKKPSLAPKSLSFMIWSLCLSIVLFGTLFNRLELDFPHHFLIPGIVIGSTVVAYIASNISHYVGGLRRGKVENY